MKNYLTQFTAPFRFFNAIRNISLKLKFGNLLIGRNSRLEAVKFETNISLGDNVLIHNANIGKHSYVASFSIVRNTKIGRFCSIGPYVKIGLGNHPTAEFISTHPIFYSLKKQSGTTFTKEQVYQEELFVEIGHDVWIGAGAIIMDGVKIANGAIIAAGAVVTKDVSPYEIVGGVPAKHIRSRFTDEEIMKIQMSEWWNKDETWLRKNANAFCNKEAFLTLITT